MNLHEYQAKTLFAQYGLPVPKHWLIEQTDDIDTHIRQINNWPVVAKAQVHAGGRGKAGGVKLCDDAQALRTFCAQKLHQQLVTHQTTVNGQFIKAILIEQASIIQRELYLGMLVDRARRCISLIASSRGGMEIEQVAAQEPDQIMSLSINPLCGLMPFQARQLAFALDVDAKKLFPILQGMYQLFTEKDLSLIEINPLVVDGQGNLICVDAKISIDDNALYRQKALEQMRDPKQEDPREYEAAQWQLNYVALDGNIGCMVNGAGLAMATMDIIKLYGGKPANFLDVGGGTTTQRVSEAFKLILSDQSVGGILINIFGGIVRCDLIAEGIIEAMRQMTINVPVVVRLEGNHARQGLALLAQSDLQLISAADLTDAARQIVQVVQAKTMQNTR